MYEDCQAIELRCQPELALLNLGIGLKSNITLSSQFVESKIFNFFRNDLSLCLYFLH
jgi:hypothetical protein